MANQLTITGVRLVEFEYTLHDIGTDYLGFNLVYEAGSTLTRRSVVLQIETDAGIVGECVTSRVQLATLPMFVHYLLGKNALERERIYQDVKRALRQVARMGLAIIDVALWDIAGKFYEAPVFELLGGYRRPLKCYASTTHGDHNGGLDCPDAYADFAERCADMGYPAFKIHGWGNSLVDLEIANIHAVGKRVGSRMDLMLDPACELNTFGDTIKVGRACDEESFFWLDNSFGRPCCKRSTCVRSSRMWTLRWPMRRTFSAGTSFTMGSPVWSSLPMPPKGLGSMSRCMALGRLSAMS